MSYANYREIERAIRARTPFVGNSARGELGRDSEGYYYAVFSYRTKIAEMRASGSVWVSDTKYSQTTSRLQNIIRRVWLP